ncbi:MAG: TrgA family protein [Sulfitobacter sp.]
MPSAARLVAAICLAIVAYIVSQMVKPLMPDGTDFGYFDVVNVSLGVLVGWIAMGKRGGRGIVSGINNGFTGVFLLVFWALFVQACNEMTALAMKNRYDNVFEAITAVFQIGAEYGVTIATLPVGLTLVASAVIVGLLTEIAHNRWL